MFEKLYTQKLYADQVGARLDLFKVQAHTPYRANFRCPICGDSQKNRYKKRGYFIEGNGSLIFTCHNECGSMGFEKFLKDYFGDIYTMYKFDLFKSMRQGNFQAEEINENEDTSIELFYDIDLNLAQDNKVAYEYLLNRKVPEQFYQDIYYTDQFHQFINSIVPDKFPESISRSKEPRLVLPLRSYDRKIFGVISRSLVPNAETRYLTIKFDEDSPKFFGLDRINLDQTVYVTEGPIDSFFISNCGAIAGTDGNPDSLFSQKSKYVIVLDNQPRSSSVLKKYEMYINRGCQMVIWPSKLSSKDVNDMILNEKISIDELNDIIRVNTYCGLKLKIMFNDWRRLRGNVN